MSIQARDLLDLRAEVPASPELQRIAAELIAEGVADERDGL